MGTLIDPLEHPAVRAWGTLLPARLEPTSIAALRDRDKTAVYRLDGVGLEGAPVVAKRCHAATGGIERTVYEEILPHLPVTALHYYGHVAEDDGSCWLFLEDAGGVPFSPLAEGHRVLVARWLALLHTSAARVRPATPLPDRGPAHYLDHLRSARRTILDSLGDSAASPGDREVLEGIVAQCDVVEARWHEVEEWCAALPATLVHGDFRPKNVHVRADGAGARLLAMDWETAGWGAPAADLASIRGLLGELDGLTTYQSIARESWPGLDVRSILRSVEAGKFFRRLAAISWSSLSLSSRWEKGVAHMQVHQAELAAAIEAASWTR